MGNYQLDILGISECRWTGSGKMNTKNDQGESYTIIHSGQKDTHHRNITLIMNRKSTNTLMKWEPINVRLIKARFRLALIIQIESGQWGETVVKSSMTTVKFVNFCLNNNCVIGGTIFQHKEIHNLTWKSWPNSKPD